jgi:hypothetical protein
MPEEDEEAISPDVARKLEEGLLDDAKELEDKLDDARNGERSMRGLKQVD